MSIVEQSIQAPSRPSGAFSVHAQIGAPPPRSCQRLGNHEIEVDTARADPTAGVFSRQKSPRSKERTDQRRAAKARWIDTEISVRCVLRNCEIGGTSVHVDRLSPDQHDRVAVWRKRFGSVE